MAWHHDRRLHVRGVVTEIGDEGLGEALHGELGGAVRGVRDVRAQRGPEAVDAAGVDDVALFARQQQRHEHTGAQVYAAPAHVEGGLPLVASVCNETSATADAGVVEQQVDVLRVVISPHGLGERDQLCFLRHVGHECRDQGAFRRVSYAEREGFGHVLGRHVAHRDMASLGTELARQLSAHARATAGDDCDPALEVFHDAKVVRSPDCATARSDAPGPWPTASRWRP